MPNPVYRADCRACPRLAKFLDRVKADQPAYFGKPRGIASRKNAAGEGNRFCGLSLLGAGRVRAREKTGAACLPFWGAAAADQRVSCVDGCAGEALEGICSDRQTASC